VCLFSDVIMYSCQTSKNFNCMHIITSLTILVTGNCLTKCTFCMFAEAVLLLLSCKHLANNFSTQAQFFCHIMFFYSIIEIVTQTNDEIINDSVKDSN